MPNTATYIVSNPSPGTIYYAPSNYWVVPSNATNVTCTVQTTNSSGTLTTVTSLTAYIHNQSNNTNTNSFTGSGAYSTSTVSNSGTNGSNVFTAGGKVGSAIAQLRMYLSYTGSVYDQPPGTPTNVSPSNNNVVNTLTPALVASFNPGTSGDTLAQYVFSMCNGFNNSGGVIYNSPTITANSYEITNNRMAHVYDGPALSFGNNYSWVCRLINQNGLSSPVSAFGNFSTAVAPNAPTLNAPTGQQTTQTPGWSLTYSSPAGTAMQSYHWWIANNNNTTLVYDNGTTTHSATSGTTITGSIPGGANLQFGIGYTFNAVVTDTNGATSGQSSQSFSIASVPVVTPTAPINNSTATTTTPTFTWSYSDPGLYIQQSYQIKIYNKSSGALIKDTGVVSSAATSYVLSGTTISFGTSIRWIIQVVDSAGIASGFSPSQFALVNNSPTAAITSIANLGQVFTNTPTVTWTYTASSGGYPQASAVVTLQDTNFNTIGTFTVSGTGTSYTLTAGLIVNLSYYNVFVTVTDTNSVSGTSSTINFNVFYTPPADMQGQGLSNAINYCPNPYLNVDGGAGRPVGWTGFQTGGVGAYTAIILIDPSITTPISQANGDGLVVGAHKLGVSTSAATGFVQITTHLDVMPNTGWTVNSTHLSLEANVIVQTITGLPQCRLAINFQNSSFVNISTAFGPIQYDTGNQVVRLLGPQNLLIPTGTAHVYVELDFISPTSADLGYAWFMDVQIEAAAASDVNFIAGDLGTGYAFDTHGFSDRTLIVGNQPTLTSNPGASNDPIGSSGGTSTIQWDTTLADGRFTAYLIDRRRQDDVPDDADWVNIASVTGSSVSSYTDFTAGSNVVYQYSVRQQIQYVDGSVGVSQNRAIVSGACNFSPAWYLTNIQSTIYNMRLNVIDTTRDYVWNENATYTQFLDRTGQARDAGPAFGYSRTLIIYFNDSWGDSRQVIRRQLIFMQQLNVVWSLRDPEGLVVPMYLQNIDFKETDTWSDTLMTATLHLLQAEDTADY